jgi:uncharacterized Fe-S radical SAM superfamily protein PflX
MKQKKPITSLFVDVGGVLLTNGWDHHARRRAVAKFKLDWAEMEERHRLVFEIHEDPYKKLLSQCIVGRRSCEVDRLPLELNWQDRLPGK